MRKPRSASCLSSRIRPSGGTLRRNSISRKERSHGSDYCARSARETRGKNEARRLRVSGNVPATLYGGKGEALSLAVNTKQVTAILRSDTGHNTLFQVEFGGKQQPAIVKDWQVDPVSGRLLHVDLLRVAMDVRMKVKVPVQYVWRSYWRKGTRRRVRSGYPRSGSGMLAGGHPDRIQAQTSVD